MSIIKYLPARLVETQNKSKWYITYQFLDPQTRILIRRRPTFNINRIRSKRERRKYGVHHVNRINKLLALGLDPNLPYDPDENQKSVVKLKDALDMAMKFKLMSDRENTRRIYISSHNIFSDYLKEKGLLDIPVEDFTKKQAITYLDHVIMNRTIKPRTYNNYIINLKALFYVLLKREIVLENPFVGIGKLKVGKKMRNPFTDFQKKVLANAIFKKDKWLALTVILIYHCMIRPVEIRRLRFYMIQLDRGVIVLPGEITKNRNDSVVTIPDVALPFLKGFGFDKYPSKHYIFGVGVQPHPSLQMGKNTMYHRHKVILRDLYKKGVLKDIDGLSLYSWKDTGDVDLIMSNVNIISVRDHNRHTSLDTTNAYIAKWGRRDPEIAGINFTIIPNRL